MSPEEAGRSSISQGSGARSRMKKRDRHHTRLQNSLQYENSCRKQDDIAVILTPGAKYCCFYQCRCSPQSRRLLDISLNIIC